MCCVDASGTWTYHGGTIQYAAPELLWPLRSKPLGTGQAYANCGPPMDCWALGLTAFEVLTGFRLFAYSANAMPANISQHTPQGADWEAGYIADLHYQWVRVLPDYFASIFWLCCCDTLLSRPSLYTLNRGVHHVYESMGKRTLLRHMDGKPPSQMTLLVCVRKTPALLVFHEDFKGSASIAVVGSRSCFTVIMMTCWESVPQAPVNTSAFTALAALRNGWPGLLISTCICWFVVFSRFPPFSISLLDCVLSCKPTANMAYCGYTGATSGDNVSARDFLQQNGSLIRSLGRLQGRMH